MGIKSLLGFGQARDKPVRNYSNGEYSFNFGQSTSGKSVNEIRNIDKGLSDAYKKVRRERHFMSKNELRSSGERRSAVHDNRMFAERAFYCIQKKFLWI